MNIKAKRENDGEPITAEQLAALQVFAKQRGRGWKTALHDLWVSGGDRTPELQQLRNTRGPSWLVSFRLPRR